MLEHYRQTGRWCTLEFWSFKGIPSMRVLCSGLQLDPDMFRLSGGLYTCFVHFFIFLSAVVLFGFEFNAFFFSIICVGLVQFYYGYYEQHYLGVLDRKDYMMWHYVLYGMVISVFSLIWLAV